MRWQTLADGRPEPGQAVLYRVRPQDPPTPAIFTEPGTWALPGGWRQTARPHHQWTPAPDTSTCAATTGDDPSPEPATAAARHLGHLDPTTRELLRTALDHHPELLEEWGAQA